MVFSVEDRILILNLVDYQIRGSCSERVYRSQIRDVDQLKSRLIEGVDILNTDFRCADVLPFARTHT